MDLRADAVVLVFRQKRDGRFFVVAAAHLRRRVGDAGGDGRQHGFHGRARSQAPLSFRARDALGEKRGNEDVQVRAQRVRALHGGGDVRLEALEALEALEVRDDFVLLASSTRAEPRLGSLRERGEDGDSARAHAHVPHQRSDEVLGL